MKLDEQLSSFTVDPEKLESLLEVSSSEFAGLLGELIRTQQSIAVQVFLSFQNVDGDLQMIQTLRVNDVTFVLSPELFLEFMNLLKMTPTFRHVERFEDKLQSYLPAGSIRVSLLSEEMSRISVKTTNSSKGGKTAFNIIRRAAEIKGDKYIEDITIPGVGTRVVFTNTFVQLVRESKSLDDFLGHFYRLKKFKQGSFDYLKKAVYNLTENN